MSIIGVRGVPVRWKLMYVVTSLGKVIKGSFEALNFVPQKNVNLKTCYLRLSEKLDPLSVIEQINHVTYSGAGLKAFLPSSIPDIPLARKGKSLSVKLMRKFNIPIDLPAKVVLPRTQGSILEELHLKYPKLSYLNKKTDNKLMAEIRQIVRSRIKNIMDTNKEVAGNPFKLTMLYRKTHPHFGDFQLILSTLHRLQDAAGEPRDQLNERDMCTAPDPGGQPSDIDNIPIEKVKLACNKYSERIVNKIMEHINNLDTKITETDSEEEIAKKRVREELCKLSDFMPMIIKHVITQNFVAQKSIYHRIHMYGEPFLPSKDTTAPFLARYGAARVTRPQHTYNLLTFEVPPAHRAALLAMDGTVINGAKLIIRSIDPSCHVSRKRKGKNSELVDEAENLIEDEHQEMVSTET